MDYAPYIGKADASSLEITRSMESLEHPKQLVGVTHIKPDTVVAHKDNVFSIIITAANLDSSLLTSACIL